MTTITPNATGPGALFVKALYDYDADDRTSLSFRQGDVIQVITQLESGWWDGVIHGVRGWFPSNYCAVIPDPADATSDTEDGSESEHTDVGSAAPHRSQEEAAFWIPQATPDGRLFYFNTLTGVSTMELPLESPTSSTESGPRNRTRIHIPDQTRPPPEMLAAGYEAHDDTDYDSASEIDVANSLPLRSRTTTDATSNTSFAANIMSSAPTRALPQVLFSDSQSVAFTWDTLLDNVKRAVHKFKEAINNDRRLEFIERAEDISDHLRLLLAAATGTTDSYTGNPSALAANKALYPHFREMMSSFSKLVLSSHFAASDFRTSDGLAKCAYEADALLHGACGYVEVARVQRGEEVPRLAPGFVIASRLGGGWRNNGLHSFDLNQSLMVAIEPESESYTSSHEPLDATLLDKLEVSRKTIAGSIRQMEDALMLRDKLITPKLHKTLSDNVCTEVDRVIQSFRPFIATVEAIDLSAFRADAQNPQLEEFAMQKQRIYDMSADLILAAQAVAAPIGDEWSEARGSSLEERLGLARTAARDLDRALTQTQFSIQLLAEIIPVDSVSAAKAAQRRTNGDIPSRDNSRKLRSPPMLADIGTSRSFTEGMPTISTTQPVSSKVNRFFGEMNAHSTAGLPPTVTTQTSSTEPYLGLDHEAELTYDIKTTPPTLRGGTLTALVEQLTRHDRLDSPFNNTFLLTYQSFTTATELFEMLVKRWCIQAPLGLQASELQRWTDKKQKPIRFRVVNILKSWFDTYWMEGNDESAQKLMTRVYTFAKETVMSTSTPGAAPLMTVIQQRMGGQDAATKRMVLTVHTGSTPSPILPRNIKKVKFLDIDAIEFARQLTIIESKLYCKIKPTECLNKTWNEPLKEGDVDHAPNVKALILHSNQLTNWVAHMILTQTDSKRRQVVIKHFVAIAERCRQLNNFSTLMSIVSALGTAPIHRLNRTWAQVNQKTMATLENMRKLMNSTKNFTEYRDTLHRANPPCIPFLGVYLTDLTFIEDGIPSIIKKTDLINFAKRAKTADVISDIQQYQNVPFALQPVPELQEYMLTNMRSADDVHNMYERSLQVEPREREDEKIARLLSESGFL